MPNYSTLIDAVFSKIKLTSFNILKLTIVKIWNFICNGCFICIFSFNSMILSYIIYCCEKKINNWNKIFKRYISGAKPTERIGGGACGWIVPRQRIGSTQHLRPCSQSSGLWQIFLREEINSSEWTYSSCTGEWTYWILIPSCLVSSIFCS